MGGIHKMKTMLSTQINKKLIPFYQNLILILLASMGGFLLSLTGLSVGWMIGSMVTLGFLSLRKPGWFMKLLPQKGLNPHWKNAAQVILAIQVGRTMTNNVFNVFQSSWLSISIMMILSIVLSILLGLFFNQFTKSGMITSFYATTPGGISNMPSIAQEVGANPVIVSLIQAMRIFLVVSLIPFFALEWEDNSSVSSTLLNSTTSAWVHSNGMMGIISSFLSNSIIWTIILTFSAIGGYYVAKRLKFPAARLVGGIIGVTVMQVTSSSLLGMNVLPFFPSWMKIVAEICLGASIGVSLKKEMFVGMKKIMIVGLISSVSFVLIMAGASICLSDFSKLPTVTSILAFAPGGVAEMTITAVVLKADVPFVVAVQTLRLILIFLLLPPIFHIIHKYYFRSENNFSTIPILLSRKH